ncbi:MAG: flagellar motor protein MotD [Porticoccus sp.]|nr:flagellar motor protein MotD [Porticoccus sp.]
MSRRSQHEEHENHERWLVSYADFITLLFAFFVVMYSISSVNEGQYRVLSDSIVSAFHSPKSSLDPIQIGTLVRSPLDLPEQVTDVSEFPDEAITPLMIKFRSPANGEVGEEEVASEERKLAEEESFTQKSLNAAEEEINNIGDNVEEKMDDLIDDDIINIKRNKFWLEVEIKSSLLFSSGSSELIPDSVPVLKKLSDIFADLPNRINVEGFTDNEPIKTLIFPSNWELSAARAAAVVRLFESNGVLSSRMAAIGYGEYQPISDNESEEGRAKNRRVVLVVMASLEGRQDERMYEFEVLKDKSTGLAGAE